MDLSQTINAAGQQLEKEQLLNIEFQEAVIEKEVAKWMASPKKMKKLTGYNWILKQFKISCI